jgi:Fur family ferric uptake transcriptional regulator
MTLTQLKDSSDRKRAHDARNYHRTQMKKDMIIKRLKERGCRITKQRQTLLDIILENECSCCKEIYYKAVKVDSRIGSATVYRMISTLEEIGAISRKNMYNVACSGEYDIEDVCTIVLDDSTVRHLSVQSWNAVIKAGLKSCGYMEDQSILSVTVRQCEYEGENCS